MFKVNTIKDYSKPKRGVKKLRNMKKKRRNRRQNNQRHQDSFLRTKGRLLKTCKSR